MHEQVLGAAALAVGDREAAHHRRDPEDDAEGLQHGARQVLAQLGPGAQEALGPGARAGAGGGAGCGAWSGSSLGVEPGATLGAQAAASSRLRVTPVSPKGEPTRPTVACPARAP